MRDLGIRRSILAASYRFAKIATLGLGQGLKSYHGWSIQMYEGKDFPGWFRAGIGSGGRIRRLGEIL